MITALLVVALLQCPDGTPPPCRGRASASAPPSHSVAVLYFENRSADSADAYLADGLTEEVISRLSGIERLSVRSRHVVRRYRGTEIADPTAIGRTLNVAYLVTGTVRRAGDRLRVSAELIQANGGSQVWGRQFDQAAGDVFAVQEAVAREVATGIVGRLVSAEQRAVAARPTSSPAAYDAYMRGNFNFARRDSIGFQRAIQEYETALRLDPHYTEAQARLSMAYSLAEVNGYPLPMDRETVLARSMRLADEAVRRAPRSSEAWMARAKALQFANPREVGPTLEAHRRAVMLDSTSAEAHHQLGALHLALLDWDSAQVHFRRSLAIDPSRPVTVLNLAEQANWAGRHREALALLDSVLALDPAFANGHTGRFLTLLVAGDTAAARAEVATWQAHPSLRFIQFYLQDVMAVHRGDSAAVEAFRTRWFTAEFTALPSSAGGWISCVLLTWLGNRDLALQVLERTRPGLALWSTIQGAAFTALHNEPRFQRVLAASAPIR